MNIRKHTKALSARHPSKHWPLWERVWRTRQVHISLSGAHSTSGVSVEWSPVHGACEIEMSEITKHITQPTS